MTRIVAAAVMTICTMALMDLSCYRYGDSFIGLPLL